MISTASVAAAPGSVPSSRCTRSPTTRRRSLSTARKASSFRSRTSAVSPWARCLPPERPPTDCFMTRRAETLRRCRRPIRAERSRAHLLGLLQHVDRRQRRRPARRPLFRAGPIRSRRRLLARRSARTNRHRSVSGPALGESRPGAPQRASPVGIRASSNRPVAALRRRKGHSGRPDGARPGAARPPDEGPGSRHGWRHTIGRARTTRVSS